MTGNPPEGLDSTRVAMWLAEHVELLEPPMSFELIAGGRSNLTFLVKAANGHRAVVRRPPVSHVLPTAHDMSREHRIISALATTAVPVAPALGFCDDLSVTGSTFYVMGYVDGYVLRDADTALKLSEPARRAAGNSLIDVLADLHAVDPDEVGLSELGKKDGYIERQLRRWLGQYQHSQAPGLAAVPRVEQVHGLLASSIPRQGPATIVHGDYRLDNAIVDSSGQLKAVLDWEICTLGDPLADMGLLMVYWSEPGERDPVLGEAPTVVEGFPTREELCERYSKRSGRDLSDLGFFISFGYWKLACILQGVVARYLSGAGGGDPSGVEGLGRQVTILADAAYRALMEKR